MKQQLINKYFSSRKMQERLLKHFEMNDQGSRKDLEDRIELLTYQQIKSAVGALIKKDVQ